MRYGILGPLSVTADGRPMLITAGRDRVVLAMLLLHAGRVLSVGALIEAVWGADPPPTARGQLQTCVSRLRRILPPGAIESDPAGYRVTAGPDDLDAAAFAQLVAAAREQGDPALYRTALDLWRGDSLAGIDSHAVRMAAAFLDEQRIVALEEWADLELDAGRERDLIGELAPLVERFPLQERLRAQLIRALAGAGRPGDALAEYRRAHSLLRDELGMDPGRDLQELHRRILEGEVVTHAVVPSGRPPVRGLPRTVTDFTGRRDLVDRLLRAVEPAAPYGPAVLALDGMAGSGKTTLALHLAALVGDRYPDAHLFVDLHGHSDHQPLDAAAALLILLRQLGVDAEQVPDDHAARVDRWRNELADRRALVVLDNAQSSAQIADLLPASPGCLALVTSRRRLAGLDGAHPESMTALAEPDAVTLLARIAGSRILTEPGAAADLVRRCGGLPLAIRLAGARLAHRPRWRVADLNRRIEVAGLPELVAENRTVAGAFTLSFEQLPGATQRAFRLLGVNPGRLFDPLAVAALADIPAGEAEDLLDDLVDVHLVEEPAPGLFRLHDLLHQYAVELAGELPPEERRAALVRALDFELHTAMALVTPPDRPIVIRDLGALTPLRPDLIAAIGDAAARMERERPQLGAFVTAAAASDQPAYAWRLARAVWRWLWTVGYNDDIVRLFTPARVAARAAGDRLAEGICCNYLASVHYRGARYEEATALVGEAIRLRREMGARAAMSTSVNNLAVIYNTTNRWVEAVALLDDAMRSDPDATDTATSVRLDAYALACSYLGRHDDALRTERRRLFFTIAAKDGHGTANSLMHIVQMRVRADRITLPLAERYLRIIHRRMLGLGYRAGEADTRTQLGELLCARGRYAEALAEFRLSLQICEGLEDRRMVAGTRNSMGFALCASGDPVAAAEMHRQAAALGRALSQPYEVARAHLGLGDCVAETDPPAACLHWTKAAEIFTKVCVPSELGQAERRLAYQAVTALFTSAV